MYEIEAGVELPPRPKKEGGKARKYPFQDMVPGDSFFVPPGEAKRARNAAYAWGHRNGIKLAIRALPDGGVRIWRTA